MALSAGTPAFGADPPPVVVDLSVLDALGGDAAPTWIPAPPARKPVPPRTGPMPAVAPPLPPIAPSPAVGPAADARPTAPPPGGVSTLPVYWQRPIPVTADAQLAQQVGGRMTAAAPSASEKLVGADVDIEATADGLSALPNGDGFRLLFAADATALSDTGERLLNTVAERMSVNPGLRLRVLAYAGGTPDTASRARVLSLERALAVRNFLFDRGIRGSRIDIRALGNTWTDGPAERVDLLLTD